MFILTYNQKGFAALFVTILVLAIMLGLGFSITILVLGEQQISKNIVRSTQSYYIAEAGIEDALWRLKEVPKMAGLSYNFNVGNDSVDVNIPDIVGGSRTIISQGDMSNRIKRIEVVYEIDSEEISFHYGAQVGDGGMQLDNNSIVNGNIFSTGDINVTGNAIITDTVMVAGLTNSITGVNINGDAHVDTCNNSTILGDLYALNDNSCNYSSFIFQAAPDPIPLPISDSQITQWKEEAEAGGIIAGDYNLSGSDKASLGPKKIQGNLLLEDNSQLTIEGTIWVVGNVNVKNNAEVHLDDFYGGTSGVLISDGIIILENNSISSGSGQPGSYLMYVSISPSNPAIELKNNTVVDIIYTSNGWITIENNADLREAIGYGIYLKNNAEISYEVGLVNVFFTSGPGGSWKVKTWEEIE